MDKIMATIEMGINPSETYIQTFKNGRIRLDMMVELIDIMLQQWTYPPKEIIEALLKKGFGPVAIISSLRHCPGYVDERLCDLVSEVKAMEIEVRKKM